MRPGSRRLTAMTSPDGRGLARPHRRPQAWLLRIAIERRREMMRVRDGDGGGAQACGPRRGRGGRGRRLRCGCTRMPPSPLPGAASVSWIAHHTIHRSPPIGIFSRNISQMNVQLTHPTVPPQPRPRRSGWQVLVGYLTFLAAKSIPRTAASVRASRSSQDRRARPPNDGTPRRVDPAAFAVRRRPAMWRRARPQARLAAGRPGRADPGAPRGVIDMTILGVGRALAAAPARRLWGHG